MLLGMATAQAAAVRKDTNGLLLYTPVVHPGEFDSAISYLVRRLEENASEENFMSGVFDLDSDESVFAREAQRFADSLADLDATRAAAEPHPGPAAPGAAGRAGSLRERARHRSGARREPRLGPRHPARAAATPQLGLATIARAAGARRGAAAPASSASTAAAGEALGTDAGRRPRGAAATAPARCSRCSAAA